MAATLMQERAYDFYWAGETQAAIAQRFRVTQSAISQRLSRRRGRLGIPNPRPRHQRKMPAHFIQLSACGNNAA